MLSVDCGFPGNGGSSGSANLEYFGPTLPVQIGFDPAYNNGSGLAPQNTAEPTARIGGYRRCS